MSDTFVKKNVKLSLEFDEYLVNHPKLFKDIPHNAYIVITVNGDDKFNSTSRSIIKNKRHKKVVEAHKTSSGSWNLRPVELTGSAA